MITGRIGHAVLVVALAGGAGAECSWAQTVEVPTHQAMSGVELTLTMSERGTDRILTRATTRSASTDAHQLRIGSEVVICFTASRSGYITLWSVDENDRPTRVYPNRFSHEDGEEMAGAPVAEGMRYCLGDDSRFNFTVGGRAGSTYQLSLNWTPVEDDALPSDAYVQIGPRTRSASEEHARFAATHLSYSPTD
ncbi:MAG: DUF4384 domain-containing protein [Pararhodobacter sp.]|nr:DUF4384 domain-containing protein [Pararhodobacter sp.]